ncbi:MAG TPA: SHOCT domain-containing protein [Pseudolysinimonas sp.]|nr:SHOCT domain-containing protein [Pseudolysinimonas sp.]
MFTSLALAPAVAHPALGFGFGLLFVIGHVIWFLIIVAIIIAVVRGARWRRRAWAGGMVGPWGYGHGHGYASWGGQQATRAAETTLAERFAQGDIDEKEYRARLEVLRANAPQPPMGPTGPQK